MGIASDFTYGMSPEEDDMHPSFFEDGDDDLPAPSILTKRKSSSAASRKGPQGADKRATHNAIERARRESLNGRFMTLAEALPSMSKVKRPSKSVIVNKALDFVFEAQVKEHALIKENNDLRREVDSLRRQLGLPPLPPPAPLTTSDSSSARKNALSRQASAASTSLDSSSADLANSMSNLDTNAVSPTQSSSAGDKLSPATSSFPSPPASLKIEAINSPCLSYPTPIPSLFANAGSPTGSLSDPSDSFSASSQLSTSAPTQQQHAAALAAVASASPFAMHHQMTMNNLHAQSLMPNASNTNPAGVPFGYLSPAMLQSHQQQQSMLFAAALQQQQQQVAAAQQQVQGHHPFDIYGMNQTLMAAGAWANGGFSGLP